MANFIKLPSSTSSPNTHLVNAADIMRFVASDEKGELKLSIYYRTSGDNYHTVVYQYETPQELDNAFMRFQELVTVKEFDAGKHKPYTERPFPGGDVYFMSY
ncbi:hypothetical protein [Rufibacter quisquiliarum]|uniref:Uncharacterized protein n=1 Tax=Rufibacter quisquiliarum TaxID=1549639 RepID=A0A839GKI5_9BACT|nr:hypothetical protein [Rufibacter quisquiliarum]MBA9076105.1 hypothetical protein [Rufibacter quisquiliarum]